jgi:hypothetical protein
MILRTRVKRPASAPRLQIQSAVGRFGALDPDSLKSLGLSESTKVPLMIAGQVSLRSALELLLDPLDLAFNCLTSLN